MESYVSSYKLLSEITDPDSIIPIIHIMKEYLKRKDMENAEIWLNKGRNVIYMLDKCATYHKFEFQLYELLSKGDDESFINLIKHSIIPWLEEKELHIDKIYYFKILANYYFKHRKYKLSAIYYHSIINTSNLLKKELLVNTDYTPLFFNWDDVLLQNVLLEQRERDK